MKSPVLVVMAAGMGSRYGGLKQIDPVGSAGEIITDFSLYDARMAGFEKVVFVIGEGMEADLRALMDDGAAKHMDIRYAFQRTNDLPAGFSLPSGRVKPWGTCHAVLAAKYEVDGPFAVINADDYYGSHAWQLIYDFLLTAEEDERTRYAMVGYPLRNTLTENGHVARGVCVIGEDGLLSKVEERKKIMRREGGIAYTDDDEHFVPVPEDSTVSMNFWGFTERFLDEIDAGFPAFLSNEARRDPLGAEYLLPVKVDQLLQAGCASVKVLPTDDRWYGVTYKEDRAAVVDALQSMKDQGLYPERLWR
ncbi:MAG: nucleotidyltransferase [Clostridiales Family XIII bacterium]|jgi:hypothetical protein|nr:nucleotidyltransferase [Clostridiales Family XIII bacterium]